MMSSADLHPFGARVKIIHNLPSARALSPRTSGDPRGPQQSTLTSTIHPVHINDNTSGFTGFFMGWSGGSSATALVLEKTDTCNRIKRVHHVIVDQYAMSFNPDKDKLQANEAILRQCAAIRHQGLSMIGKKSTSLTKLQTDANWDIKPLPDSSISDLDIVGSLFDPDDCATFDLTLPPKGKPIGITMNTDQDALAPFIVRINPGSQAYSDIPLSRHFCNNWIVFIHNEQPLTGAGAKDAFESLQLKDKSRVISITLCKMSSTDSSRYEYQNYRAAFDSCTGMQYTHMAVLPRKPLVPKTIFQALDGNDRDNWIKACHYQYNKNQRVGLFSQPIPRELVPKDKKVLQTVLATKVKKVGEMTWEYVTRMCANGSTMQKGEDFEYSWAPTIGAPPLRLTMMLASANRLTLAIMDVENCFQNTLLEEKHRVIVTMPPLYLDWFRKEYPNYKIDRSPSGKYVLQALKGLQGDKKIGRAWYLLLKKLLEKFGCVQCLEELALYKYEKDGFFLLVNTSTDDFLCAYNNEEIFSRLLSYLRRHFGITTKTGSRLDYLNLRIIQSSAGISYDQTEHIQDEILPIFFPPDSTERLKPVHTPFRTDSAYERELAEALPAQAPGQLQRLEQRYKGSYPRIMGMIMHVFVWSRNDLGYALSRLSKFIQTPSEPSFAGLWRALRYLATHTHRPCLFPRQTIDGYHTIRLSHTDGRTEHIDIPNTLVIILDSDHARDSSTRRSCECIHVLVNGVAVDWKMKQDRCVALNSTDAETRCVLSGVRRGLYLQDVAHFLGLPLKDLRPTPIFEDSQPCIDICEAKTVTSRVKHIAVPIHFIHEKINDGRFKMYKIGTNLNPSDSGTKPSPAPTHFRHFDYTIGVRFYPPADTEHYKLLQLDKFLCSPYHRTDTSHSPPT